MVYFLKRKDDALEATEKFLATSRLTVKLNEYEVTTVVSLSIKNLSLFCESIRLDTKQAPHTPHTKTVQFKERGEVCLVWLGVCY